MGTEASRRPSPAHAPQLDGLRAIAVAAVAYAHWLPRWQAGLPFGAGVHLFFVLSGFLITRILMGLRTSRERGEAVRRFYLRRILRLFPAFYLVLGAALVANVPLVRATWGWHAGYLSNVFIAAVGTWQGHLSHFWSLAVEEQFYLVWPWLIVWTPARWLGPLVVGAVALGPAARLAAAAGGLSEPFWALVPGGSADSLALGALLAWSASRARSGDAHRRPATGPWALAGLAAWTAGFLWEQTGHGLPPALAVWRQVAQGLVFVWIVDRAAAGNGRGMWPLLASPALQYVGRISYGVYLIHAFAPILAQGLVTRVAASASLPAGDGARALLYAAVTLAAASAMWHLVEAPVQRLKTRVPYAQ